MEAGRGPYMMRLLDLAGLRDAARKRILEALPAIEEGWDRDWMVDLLGELATAGDTIAWDALRDLAAGGNERAQDGLAETGEAGLQWVADHVLPNLPEGERYRVSFWLPDEETDDNTPLQKRLRALYLDWDKALEARRRPRPEPKPKATGYLRKLGRVRTSYTEDFGFTDHASPRQWRAAARRFLRESQPRTLRTYRRLYRKRTFPLPHRHLFRQARHPERGWAVMEVLGTLHTPAVRRFALGLLRRRPLPWNALDAIESSLRKGDEPLVLAALASEIDESNVDLHSPVLAVIALMGRYPKLAWQPHAEWIFEHSPCSFCRGSAMCWMQEHGTIPEAFLREMPYDAEPDIRDLNK